MSNHSAHEARTDPVGLAAAAYRQRMAILATAAVDEAEGVAQEAALAQASPAQPGEPTEVRSDAPA